eukprot:scaffold7638_cov131-Isochrysis_galbana.AAC.12
MRVPPARRRSCPDRGPPAPETPRRRAFGGRTVGRILRGRRGSSVCARFVVDAGMLELLAIPDPFPGRRGGWVVPHEAGWWIASCAQQSALKWMGWQGGRRMRPRSTGATSAQ